jgi:stage III sporulation protein AD
MKGIGSIRMKKKTLGFLAAVLKSVKSEMTMLVAAGVSVFILFYILSGLSVIVEQLKMLQGYIGISGKYIGILVKMIGISYMTQLAADICRDNGQTAVAGQLEVFCKITIAALGMPVVLTLFEVVTKCIG